VLIFVRFSDIITTNKFTTMNLTIVLAIAGLLFSAFFSGAEMAYITANPMQIEVWKRQRRQGADASSKLHSRPETVLPILLTGTVLANMIAAAFATMALVPYYPAIVVFCFIALVLLTFGDILPKTIFRERANRLTLKITPALEFFTGLLYPILLLIRGYNLLFFKQAVSDRTPPQAFSKDELRLLFGDSETAGVIEPHEKRFIARLFTFGQQTAREVMTPRTDIAAVEAGKSLEEARQVFTRSGHSKLPVYHETIDHVVGVIFLHDMFDPHQTLQEIARETTFVPESKNIAELLREFQENKNSIGIVIDEYGGTAGLITIEDIVEELFGEFEDEFDFEEVTVKKTDNGYIVSGRAEIDYLNESLHMRLPTGEYETLGGFLEDRLGRIPTTGEEISIGNRKYIITKASQKKIEQVKVVLAESEFLTPPSSSSFEL